ncbi:MAG: hypothetical protein IPK07_01885 [Deltaproteobacteria bacterium]|jgi:hypothetical protein|nr:hypothetical protein [Deltaproteobacteria bacterium]
MAGIRCGFLFAWVYDGLLIASRPVGARNAIGIMIHALAVAAFVRFSAASDDFHVGCAPTTIGARLVSIRCASTPRGNPLSKEVST